jgi:hypothetical protein
MGDVTIEDLKTYEFQKELQNRIGDPPSIPHRRPEKN